MENKYFDVNIKLNNICWTCHGKVEFDLLRGEPMRMPNARDDVGYPGDPDEVSEISVAEIECISCEDSEGNEHIFSYTDDAVMVSPRTSNIVPDCNISRPDEALITEQIELYFEANQEELIDE